MSNLYRGPSIDASYQGSVNLASGFSTRFYLIKTKQSGYYLNLFHESNLLSYLCWLTHPGLNVCAPTFKSRDQYIRIDASYQGWVHLASGFIGENF
jgi:hypothetical protein